MANLHPTSRVPFCKLNNPPFQLLLGIHHLQLAVVLSNSDNLGPRRRVSGDGCRLDAPARAGRRVSLGTIASRGIGGDSGGTDGGGGIVDIVLGLRGNTGVNSDGDGGGSSHPVSKIIVNRCTLSCSMTHLSRK